MLHRIEGCPSTPVLALLGRLNAQRGHFEEAAQNFSDAIYYDARPPLLPCYPCSP